MDNTRAGSEAPRELSFHSRRGEGRTPSGCIFILGLVLMGVLVASVALGFVIGERSALAGLRKGGLFFGAAGILMVHLAIWQFTRPGRFKPIRDPGSEAWTRYPWNPRGARDETGERAVAYLRRSLWLALFLAPVTAASLLLWKRVGFGALLALCCDLALLGNFLRGLFLLLRFRRFGGTRFLFGRFPYFLGGPLEGRLVASSRLPAVDRMTLTLRCVEESIVEGRKSSRDAAIVTWSSESRPRPEDLSPDGRELRIRFELPQGAKPTNFGSCYPDYWELLVRADVPGPDYSAVFLVPVYARS